MSMPACCACLCTVEISQDSAEFDGWVITRAPVERLAIHLDIASEMKEPPKPMQQAQHDAQDEDDG
jgi:hypothetical protein